MRGLIVLLAALSVVPTMSASVLEPGPAAPGDVPPDLVADGQADVVNLGLCIGQPFEIPLVVDECGDAMTGNLVMSNGADVLFGAGSEAVFAGAGGPRFPAACSAPTRTLPSALRACASPTSSSMAAPLARATSPRSCLAQALGAAEPWGT